MLKFLKNLMLIQIGALLTALSLTIPYDFLKSKSPLEGTFVTSVSSEEENWSKTLRIVEIEKSHDDIIAVSTYTITAISFFALVFLALNFEERRRESRIESRRKYRKKLNRKRGNFL